MNPLVLSASGTAIAVLAAVATVVVLYTLKPPPRRLVVPSSLIWERVLREAHRSTERLRWWLSLLLAAGIAAAIVTAVARPQWNSAGESGARLILVLDNSPTMATRATDGATRWEHAVTRARRMLESCSSGTQVLLADTMRRIVTPGFESRDAALERLAQLRVAYGARPRVPVLAAQDGSDVVVISDGVQITDVPKSARLESVFEPVDNAGIIAFEVRPLPADPRRYQAFVEVANAGGSGKRIEISVIGIGGQRVAKTVSVPAGGVRAELLDVSDFEGGPLRASLVLPGDGLDADDVAYAWLPMRRVVRVTLVSRGNHYLEKSLRAQPRVQLTVIAPERYADSREVDAWVFDRFAPPAQPVAPALLFRPAKADWLPAPGGEIANPIVAAWNGAHPLLENLSLRDLVVERAVLIRPRGNTGGADAVLVSARDHSPLVLAHEGARRWISFSFGLEDSNFALRAGFPIFLNNALNWMVGEQVVFAAGLGVVEVPLTNARVVAADGSELPARAIPRGSLVEIAEPGFFTAVSAQQRLRVAANLLDRTVTEVNRSQLPAVKLEPIASVEAKTAMPIDPWAALLLAAVLLLGVEWWCWNRRVTV